MKNKYLIVPCFVLVLIVSIFACSGNNNGNIGISDDLPSVLINDTLINVYEYKIIDTFDTGNPLVIHFIDTDNKAVYEKRYYESGKIFIEGPLENSRRTGKWIAWYEDGVMWSLGNYKQGLRDGQNQTYYTNGVLRYSKNYINDKAEGLAKFYNPAGELVAEIVYENNIIVSQKEYGEGLE